MGMDIVERLMSRVNGIIFPDKLAEEAASEIKRLRLQVEACEPSPAPTEETAMNTLRHERYGKRRSDPLESGTIVLHVGTGGADGEEGLRLEFKDAAQHTHVLVVSDADTLKNIAREISCVLAARAAGELR